LAILGSSLSSGKPQEANCSAIDILDQH